MNQHKKARIVAVLATMKQFPVLSGRVTETQAEHIVDTLDMIGTGASAPVSDTFKIEVGGMYVTGQKEIVTIVKEDKSLGDNTYRWADEENRYYAINGKALANHDRYHLSPFDPVKMIEELQTCLRNTRQLISNALISRDDDDMQKLFDNNGTISRVVPVRAEDRLRNEGETNKRM